MRISDWSSDVCSSDLTNGRSYKGGIRGNFSYRGEGNKMPEVWVVRSADQPRARAMLREAGLMDSTRNAPDSFLSMGLRGTSAEAGRRDDMQRRAQRMKFGLLAVIVVVVALGLDRKSTRLNSSH